MNFFRFLLAAFVCLTVIFSACKKNDIFTDRLSVGSLKDSSGNCLPSSVHGEYNSGTTLLVEHYIDVHVNVDTVGAYSIATDSMNGYSFKGTGTFGIKGDNLVRLYGHGTPLFGGVDVFTVRYGSSACRVAVNVKGTAAVPAVFALDTLAGACPGVVLEGTFTSSIPATATNKAKLGVVVTTPGTYSITTTAINGISFSGAGAFTTPGPQTLVLTANGTPTASGAFNYTATVNGVSCTYSVTVAEGPSAAVFTLGGSPSTCTGFVLAGTYQAGTGMTASNTVTCQVTVTTAGAYSLSTTSANGISFSGAGTFAATGAQTVVLTATGTPTAAGTNTFTVNGASGTCSFSVITTTGITPPPSSGDYYPLTLNNYWTYDENDAGSVDTFKLTVRGSGSYGGNNYAILNYDDETGTSVDSAYYYRKSGNEYHYYGMCDEFSVVNIFNEFIYKDFIFLKEAATGTTWTSETFTGTVSLPELSASLKYVFTVVDGNASVNVNGKAYNNVIKVACQEYWSISGAPFTNTGNDERWYAKNVGLIQEKSTPTGSSTPIYELRLKNFRIY